jgi:hypothetical protein
MRKASSIAINLVLIAAIIPYVLLLSYPTALQPDTTYQTGISIVISSYYANTTYQVFAIPYVSVMTTSSLNASLGIYGVDHLMISTSFGWNLLVASVTTSNVIIHLSVVSATNYISYLKLCYMINSNTNIDMNFV